MAESGRIPTRPRNGVPGLAVYDGSGGIRRPVDSIATAAEDRNTGGPAQHEGRGQRSFLVAASLPHRLSELHRRLAPRQPKGFATRSSCEAGDPPSESNGTAAKGFGDSLAAQPRPRCRSGDTIQ